MAPNKILCVAEKPSIAKAVANHLSGGSAQTRNVQGAPYNKNYEFDFDFGPPWGRCGVIMTSVLGHISEQEFAPEFKDWKYPPPDRLFDARIFTKIAQDKQAIATNIERQAKYCKGLYIWTDCDREGEHIGDEVRQCAIKGNPRIDVKRAIFSNIERSHILQAAKRPGNLDLKAAAAVSARMELDLRTGAAFTRLQTLTLQRMGGPLAELVISYGSCQFPTLGFVVDRYLKVRNFLPEPFWKLEIKHTRDDIPCTFAWDRTRLFDRAAVTMIYERCLKSKYVTVDRVVQKSTKKWKPLPLTTVELQKNASKYLRMNSQTAMKVAEDLYNKGFISYPRTETDIFSRDMNLKTLCGKHTADNRWGDFATNLVEGGAFQWPRAGRNDDKAHPPIHPITAYNGDRSTDEGRLYEFVVRRFLACCSSDAVGTSTSVAISFPTLPVPESFHASGLQILARNYLDVYPYDQWTGSLIPAFEQGERFEPQSCMVNEGETSSPGYLTEPDLIALMDANGIGTDATMAEHIAKIKVRGYVMTQPRSGGGGPAAAASASATRGRGGARGRGSRGGRRGGRGGSNATAAGGPTTGVEEFIPTTLGVALIEGYENVGFEEKLSKPFLRKDLEVALKKIVSGEMTREEVVRREVGLYKRVYYQTEESIESLRRAARRYVFGLEGGGQA